MATFANKTCQWRQHMSTKEEDGKELFITMLLFLEELYNVLNSMGHKYTFFIFGGFIRRVVYELFSVRDQNAKPGDKNLKDDTFHGGLGDIDILCYLSQFMDIINMGYNENYSEFKDFKLRKKHGNKYKNKIATTFIVSYTDPRYKTTTTFSIDVVDPNMKQEQRFNVNCLVYELKDFRYLHNVFFHANQKSNIHASEFLDHVLLKQDFPYQNYKYHCEKAAWHDILECIRSKKAIASIPGTVFKARSDAYKEIEHITMRGAKLERDGWNLTNLNLTTVSQTFFQEGLITLSTAVLINEKSNMLTSTHLFQCPLMPKPFQDLPSYLKDIILSYNMCEHCQYENKDWCDYSSDDYETSSEEYDHTAGY
jgi:hypothetical protein